MAPSSTRRGPSTPRISSCRPRVRGPEIVARPPVVAFPDETLHDALARMLGQRIGRLPVVSRSDPHHVVGYLGRADILAARERLRHEEEIRERGPALGAG